MRDIVEMDDAVAYVQSVPSKPVEATSGFNWPAPCDLQAVKAFGVTFSGSMVERMKKEQASALLDAFQKMLEEHRQLVEILGVI